MATAKETDIASAFLKELGAPDTKLMRLAVIAWLRQESGRTIIGNNPWNIRPNAGDADLRSGTRTSINGNGKFSVYPNVMVGAKAAARMLVRAGKDWRRYDRVVAAARRNDPIGFLNALAHSAWDAGRYGTKNGGANHLLRVYKNIGGPGVDTLAAPANFTANNVAGSPDVNPATGFVLNSKLIKTVINGKFIDIPEGKTITAQDVDYIIQQFIAAGTFNNDTTGAAMSVTRNILNGYIGKPWNKQTRDQMQKDFFAAADNAIPKPLDALASIGSTLTQIVGAVLDPANWVRIIALLVGLGMTLYGGVNVLRAAS